VRKFFVVCCLFVLSCSALAETMVVRIRPPDDKTGAKQCAATKGQKFKGSMGKMVDSSPKCMHGCLHTVDSQSVSGGMHRITMTSTGVKCGKR